MADTGKTVIRIGETELTHAAQNVSEAKTAFDARVQAGFPTMISEIQGSVLVSEFSNAFLPAAEVMEKTAATITADLETSRLAIDGMLAKLASADSGAKKGIADASAGLGG